MLTDQKKIITVFFALFVLSAVFLFWQNERELDPNRGKSWWTLSFADPNSEQSLDCVIENYGANRSFTYEVREGSALLRSETFTMEPGATKTLLLPSDLHTGDERLRITVSSGEEKKEIYR